MSAAYLEALHAGDSDVPAQASSNSASGVNAAPRANGTSRNVDLESESAFPSLGASAGPSPTWSGSGKGKSSANTGANWNGSHLTSQSNASSPASATSYAATSRPVNAQLAMSDNLVLPSSSIQLATPAQAQNTPRKRGEDPPPTTLGEAIAQVRKVVASVQIQASTSKATTTFLLRGPDEESITKAKLELTSRVVKKITTTMEIPASTRAFIIGSKGRTLKSITEATNANVNIPPRDPNEDSSEDATVDQSITITITGSSVACDLAKAKIKEIVGDRAVKIVHTQTIPASDFEAVYWPLVKNRLEAAWAEDEINVSFDEQTGSVTLKGDKEKAGQWSEKIKQLYRELKKQCRVVTLSLPKRQHRFLRGDNTEAVLSETGFSMELPPQSSADETVVLRGTGDNKARTAAMSLVMEKAESAQVDTIDLSSIHPAPVPDSHHENLCGYLSRQSILFDVASEAQFYLPTAQQIANSQFEIDVTAAEEESIASAKEKAIKVIKPLTPQHFQTVKVDPLLHTKLANKDSKVMKSLLEKNKGLELVFPSSSDSESDAIYLLWPSAEKGSLSNATTSVQKIVSDLGEITTQTITVPAKLLKAVQGPNNSTVNNIIGEGKEVAVSLGPGEQVQIRGPQKEVQRVQQELEETVKQIEVEGVEASYETTFEVDSRVVSHIVGKGGSGVNKMREELGVRIDFSDIELATSAPTVNKKKPARAKAQVTVKGRRANAEEAKRRILSQADRVADEVAISIPVPAGVDRGLLIGKQGSYAQRLETKYEVKINFSRPDDDKSEINIRGPSKGVNSARKELSELIEYERENNHTATLSVSAKAVPRILGKQGIQVNEIAAETGATIELDRNGDKNTILIRGNKTAIAAAKKLVAGIAKETDEESVIEMRVDRSLQSNLIGKGGQNIRDLMAKVGGPTDSRSQGYMLRFPRPNDTEADLITLRGKSSIIEKLRTEILAAIGELNDRIVMGLEVPRASHAILIGRSGSNVNELQSKHNVKIVFPNWKEASAMGALNNAEDVKDVEPQDLLRIVGAADACTAVAAAIKAQTSSSAGKGDANGRNGQGRASRASRTVDIPVSLHRAVADGGRIFRRLPPGTNISHGDAKLPEPNAARPKPFASGKPASSARIDQDEEADDDAEFSWETMPLIEGQDSTETIPWIISGSEAGVAKAEELVKAGLESAQKATHLAYLQVPRSFMPRIVGRGGSGLERLRSETGVAIEVLGRKDADTLSLVGTPEGLESARTQIMALRGQR